jgi:hypothetical protein
MLKKILRNQCKKDWWGDSSGSTPSRFKALRIQPQVSPKEKKPKKYKK